MIEHNELPIGNFKKALIGYNCLEVNSNIRLCQNEYNKLYNEYTEISEENERLKQALEKKNIEFYELQKEYRQLLEFDKMNKAGQVAKETAQKLKEQNVFTGEVELDESTLLCDQELDENGFTFI